MKWLILYWFWKKETAGVRWAVLSLQDSTAVNMETATCVMLPVSSAAVLRRRIAPAAPQHGDAHTHIVINLIVLRCYKHCTPDVNGTLRCIKVSLSCVFAASLMRAAVSLAAMVGVMRWAGSATSVTTPVRSVQMRDLTTVPAVTEVHSPSDFKTHIKSIHSNTSLWLLLCHLKVG